MPSERTPGEDPLRHLFDESSDKSSAETPPMSRRERRKRDTAAEQASDDDGQIDSDGESSSTAGDGTGDENDTDLSDSESAAPDPVSSSFDLLTSPTALDDRAARRRRAQTTPEKPKKRAHIILWTLLPMIVIAAIVASGFYVWNTFEPQIRSVMGWEEPNDFVGQGEGEVLVVIADGDTGSDIAATLSESGVTKTSEVFYQLLLTQKPEPTFQPGTYSLKKKMSAHAALSALLDPDNKVERTALIQEGITGEVILQRLSEATEVPLDDLRSAAENPADFGIPDSAPSIEGWLFPAVYEFEPGMNAHDVIQKLVDRMIQALDEANVAPENRETVLTTASIIQREARQKDDFYKVSRVIQNRLDAGMKLQMDSTAQYGVDTDSDSVWSSKEALESDSPWNTYKHEGLPIGPIASPGDLAIDAAVNPVAGDWIYFVTVNLNTGETVFSTTNAEHEKAVKQLRTWCDKNPGNGC